MTSVKLSVSLSDDDLAVLDGFVRDAGLASRSAGVQRAIALLKHPHLETDYESAWNEWDSSGDASAWDSIVADGLTSAAG
jgi:hypothetical protein